jgi:hypothetical protein
MAFLSVLISAIAAFLLYKSEHNGLMIIAIFAVSGSLCSWGIMQNYATEMAKRRQGSTGGVFGITIEEAAAVPNWITWVSMGFTLLGVVLLIAGFVSLEGTSNDTSTVLPGLW